MAAKIFRYYGFAEESVSGTAETVHEMDCDAQTADVGAPKEPEMEFEGSMGRGKNVHRPDVYVSAPSAEVGTDIKVLDRLLYFTLGENVETKIEGTTEGYDTKLVESYSTDDIMLPSFTSFIGIDLDEYVISGCVADKLTVSVDKDFIITKIETKGRGVTLGTLKTKTQLKQNKDYPLAFYDVNVHMRDLGSTTAWGTSTNVTDTINKLELSIENSISESDGQVLGTRFPKYLPAGDRTVSVSFDSLYISNQWIEKLNGSANGPQDDVGSTEFEMMVEIDAGIYGIAQLYFPRVIVTSAPLSSKGRDAITQSVDVDAYEDTVLLNDGTTSVSTELLATFKHYYTDSTAQFDGPATGL